MAALTCALAHWVPTTLGPALRWHDIHVRGGGFRCKGQSWRHGSLWGTGMPLDNRGLQMILLMDVEKMYYERGVWGERWEVQSCTCWVSDGDGLFKQKYWTRSQKCGTWKHLSRRKVNIDVSKAAGRLRQSEDRIKKALGFGGGEIISVTLVIAVWVQSVWWK